MTARSSSPTLVTCERCGQSLGQGEPHSCPADGSLNRTENAVAIDALSATAQAPAVVVFRPSTDKLRSMSAPSAPTPPVVISAAPSAPTLFAVPPAPSDAADPLLGTVIGDKIEILRRIGQGGMGVVYRARHRTLDSPLAVKVLLRAPSPQEHQRFLLEARMASRVRHPNTVYISDFGQLHDGRDYLVMELLRGRLLAKELTAGPLEPSRALRIAIGMARGLQAVHDQGIVHRDLKPENVFLVSQDGSADFVKLVDFGIAKRVGVGTAAVAQLGGSSADVPPVAGTPEPSLTEPGAIIGTPRYMAPEQALGHDVDPRTDQYALGCVLYHMLTGTVPFDAPAAMDILLNHVNAVPTPPRMRLPRLQISAGLESIVLRLLSKTREQRFPSMRDVEAALSEELDLMLVRRGERRLLAPAVAQTLDGGRGDSAVIVAGRRYPLWLVVLLLAGLLVLVAVVAARLF